MVRELADAICVAPQWRRLKICQPYSLMLLKRLCLFRDFARKFHRASKPRIGSALTWRDRLNVALTGILGDDADDGQDAIQTI